MASLRAYLDTSVINHLFHEDVPERKQATLEFFRDSVLTGALEVYISAVVLDEISRTTDEVRRQELLSAVEEYDLQILSSEEHDIIVLAMRYIEDGVIPPSQRDDALHVAIATYHEMDMLISWNFRHLANVRKELRIAATNLTEGYTKLLRISSPLEVVGE